MSSLVTIGLVALITTVSAQFPDCVSGLLSNNSVCDTKLDAYSRATALVAEFTLSEKIQNSRELSPGVPRIGLPAYEWWNEALHGVAVSPGVSFAGSGDFSYATSFPQPILMGAAFDDDLIQQVAGIVSTEARAFNNYNRSGLNYWTPNINPFKDPRWGRGQETPGEDPYHISRYVAKLILGLQGNASDKYQKVSATCKHYAGYDMEVWNGIARYAFDAIINPQDLRDYYLPAFQTCARDSKVQAIMCSYNALNGVPTCADDWLLQTVLREHWGWNEKEQYVVSDCDAVHNIFNGSSWNVPAVGHNYTKTPEEAVAVALNAGTDMDCGSFYPTYLPGAYEQGLFNISTLDRSLIRRYASLVKLGYFDAPTNQPYRQLKFSDVSSSSAQSLALQAAEEGIVLLKNTASTLPLAKSIKKLALIGPLANSTTQMQGNYEGVAPYLHSPLYAAQMAGYTVTYVQGTNISDGDSGFSQALTAAASADAVIFLGGLDKSVEAESLDRYNITWPETQLELITKLAALSKPLIVVQMGTMVDSSSLVSNAGVKALVWAGYPGQDGGTAIFNILTGKVAPAGRLPVTQYPADYVNQVPMTNMSLHAYSSPEYSLKNPGRTYKHYTGTPVFPFGYGLHYTNFSVTVKNPLTTTYTISSLSSKTATYADLTAMVTIPVTIKNIGSVASSYVAMVYLSGSFGPAPYPLKKLVGYQRVSNLGVKQSQTVSIQLTLGSLARADEAGNMVLWPGNYEITVDGAASGWNFTLTGTKYALDAWPASPSLSTKTATLV